jgi:hypothetical protein
VAVRSSAVKCFLLEYVIDKQTGQDYGHKWAAGRDDGDPLRLAVVYFGQPHPQTLSKDGCFDYVAIIILML